MKYFIGLATIVFSVCAYSSDLKTKGCTEGCHAPFGSCIGQAFLTKAYSNCNGDCVSNETNYVTVENTDKKIVSGMKWQCVEYARRWLIDNKHVTFADVEYAYHIWNLKNGEDVSTKKPVPLLQFSNKKATTKPEVGDLLIYSTEFAITGHVAVVVSVENHSITVAEQNYFNDLWNGPNFSRRLLLERDEENRYRIFDEALIGWVRFAS